MALSYEAVINGVSVCIFVFLGWIIGIAFIINSRKTKAKLLFYYGLLMILGVSNWLGTFLDFLFVIAIGENIGIALAIIGYNIMPLSLVIAMFVFSELAITKRKHIFLSFYIVLAIIFEFILLINPERSVNLDYPTISGSDLVSIYLTMDSPIFFISLIFQLSMIVFLGFGFLIKGILSSGLIRKKFFLLSTGWLIFVLCAMIDNIFDPGVYIILVRIGLISNGYFAYLGLREEPIKIEGIHEAKEIEVEKSLFRIYKRDTPITEEEITFHKDKKICLVCKGPAVKYTYICPKCEALYCQNCAETLENIENACWACSTRINEKKPYKPFKIDQDIYFKP